MLSCGQKHMNCLNIYLITSLSLLYLTYHEIAYLNYYFFSPFRKGAPTTSLISVAVTK